jgi:hypothetical protein
MPIGAIHHRRDAETSQLAAPIGAGHHGDDDRTRSGITQPVLFRLRYFRAGPKLDA